MASLQAQVFVNDEWVTQTVTAEELLGTSRPHPKSVVLNDPAPPKYGVLTRTIIESPIIRWVLPIQLRSPLFNDVALVGDQSVQICELGTDTQLQPIARKVSFSSKIRNCRAIGTNGYLTARKHSILRDISSNSSSSPTSTPLADGAELFQQVLVLVLAEELVFLFMNRTATGDWKFVSSHYPITSGTLAYPGFQMTISPDGGYLALACSEDLFIVYQLESIQELRRQHSNGLSIKPIKSVQARAVRGVVHKLEFLYPGFEKQSYVILLIITAHEGVLRLAVYDWENSERLQDALAVEKSGHRLDVAFGVPLLIIPLTVCSQFLIITDRYVAICSDVLGGPPEFIPLELTRLDKTDWHYGTHTPMWTTWTRPMREGNYHTNTDVIYLAREDGWVNRLEVKGDSGVETSLYMGPLECNIDSEFASLSTSHGEILVAGGNYGPGAIWLVKPRKNPKHLGPLLNWSPTIDLVLTKDANTYSKSDNRKSSKRPVLAEKARGHMLAPERAFACSGRGFSGAIVELRYGIQAKIGLDLLYSSPIKKCWAIPSFDDTSVAAFFMLLSLPETSALLHISHDFSEVSEKSQNEVKFDLLSPTLAVYVSKDIVIQITTTHATILSPTSCYQHSISDMIEGPENHLTTVTDAAITREILALSVYSQSIFKIIVFDFNGTTFRRQRVFTIEGEVTTLSVNTLSAGVCVLAGLSQKDLPTLAIFPIDPSRPEEQELVDIPPASINLYLGEGEDDDSLAINAVTSILCHGNKKILIGMRNGDVLTIGPTHPLGEDFTVTRTNHFGVSPSHVSTGMVFSTGPSTLVCNDAGVAIMKELDGKRQPGCFEEISRVWLTDVNEPHSPSPTINSVAKLHEIPDYGDSTWAMVAGTHILIVELQTDPGPVPRHIPTKGTPLGILYSERLGALITVVVKKGVPSLHFLDPITGADLSRPTRRVSDQDDEQYADVDYITCLGNPEIKVASLLNWRYKNKGNLYEWFVVLAKSGDDQGRLAVVFAEQETAATHTGSPRRIRFWTQFSRKIKDGSPRSGTTDDYGLFLNFGTTLEYHVIEDKKFRTAMKYDLPSPATSLEVVDGHLHVLTAHHSLVILDYKSDVAVRSQRMVQVYTDQFCRNGTHSVDVGSFMGIGEPQRLVLMSNLMCTVYGLWSPSPSSNAANLQSIFRADLMRSIKKFVHGHTRPRWTRDQPRYGNIRSRPDRHDILGLAVDGSLSQFSILPEDVWRLLRYVQILAMRSKDNYLVPCGHSSPRDLQLDINSNTKTEMHVNGDILQRCLETKALERIVLTRGQLNTLQNLLKAFDLGTDEAGSLMPDEALTTYEYTYSILDHYLAPAL
ncbi:hypothetical protein GGR51DRAFT_340203 [Nemania sp. FL0031]|nr:hypothetical protein GGR51DRAFT_340203 [Nemania sp. FL0031]